MGIEIFIGLDQLLLNSYPSMYSNMALGTTPCWHVTSMASHTHARNLLGHYLLTACKSVYPLRTCVHAVISLQQSSCKNMYIALIACHLLGYHWRSNLPTTKTSLMTSRTSGQDTISKVPACLRTNFGGIGHRGNFYVFFSI